MKTILAVTITVLLSACASSPVLPVPPDPCVSLETCGEQKLAMGLGADRTVQTMVHSPLLIRGLAAEPSEWPASVYATTGNASCSATLVGDRVLFMAAHCMGNGGSVSFTAHANAYKARCAHHPEYKNGKGNKTADWALCLVDRPVTGVPFEVVATDKTLLLGQSVLLSGYGCINEGGGGGNDGIFRIGFAAVHGNPSGQNYWFVTKGGAALCYGDSGGAAYLLSGAERHLVGINSQGNIATDSYLASVQSKTLVSWAKSWALASNNVRICGLHDDALGCRASSPKPQPDGKFEITAKAACLKGIVKPDFLNRKNELVDGLRKLVEQF